MYNFSHTIISTWGQNKKKFFFTTISHSLVYYMHGPAVYRYLWSTNHIELNIILTYRKQRNAEKVVEHMCSGRYFDKNLLLSSIMRKNMLQALKNQCWHKKCMHILNQWQTKLIMVLVAVVNNPHARMQIISHSPVISCKILILIHHHKFNLVPLSLLYELQ